MSGITTKPLDFLTNLIGKYIEIKCREGRQIKGVLNAYDDHLNILMSNVEEIGKNVNGEVEERKIAILYVRGDGIIGISRVKDSELEKMNIRDRLSNTVMV